MDTDLHAKSGQALVEFCIGLIAMLTVIGGILQLGRLGLARTEARVDATRVASAQSMLSAESTHLSIPSYIDRMLEGGDGATYSFDDSANISGAEEAYERLVEPSRPGLLRLYAPGNDFAEMDDTFEMRVSMGLVAGVGREYNIPVLPVVRRLIFNQPNVDIEVTSWMVRTGDLY